MLYISFSCSFVLKNYLIKDSQAFYNKPESEKKKENVTAKIRNYIRRIKSMAMEVIIKDVKQRNNKYFVK